MNRTLKTVLLSAALSGAVAHAAPSGTPAPTNAYMGGSITREYRASDLKQAYGILDIAMGEIWVLNLPDDVVDVITSREGVLQFSQRGQRVVIGATASTGSYPILVMTADSVYFFQARLSASRGGGVRNIVVRADQAPEPEQQIPGFPTAAAPTTPAPTTLAPTAAPAPSSDLTPTIRPAATRPAAPAPLLAAAPVQAAAPSPAPVAAAPARVTPAPLTLRADVEFRAITNGVRTRVYYRITNSGDLPITFDERRLIINGVQGFGADDAPTAMVTVAPGETRYGQVDVATAPTTITAQWQGLGADGRAAAQVTRSVQVEPLGAS